MNDHVKAIIEALIFVSQDPVTLDKIRGVLEDASTEDVQAAVDELIQNYEEQNRGIRIVLTGGGYIFATRPDCDSWVRKFLQIERKNRLSMAALETLCTVAYHQPVTHSEIAALRGVDSAHSLKTLLDKKLVKIVGRKKAPGNPLIYKTSDKFLLYFGLNSIEELPSEEEISKILQEEKSSDV